MRDFLLFDDSNDDLASDKGTKDQSCWARGGTACSQLPEEAI